MDIGLIMFATDSAMNVVDVGREAEARGFDALFLPEHTHIPARTDIERPRGGGLPEQYRYIFDPFVALGAVATATTRLRLGTGVCLAAQRDPIIMAKEVATLDVLSGGRVILGVGAGWLAEEMSNHGVNPDNRFQVLREHVDAMKHIWRSEVAEYHGSTVEFGPMWQWPKPLQHPHPPIMLGGVAPGVVDRIASYADGWLPFPGKGDALLAQQVNEVQRKAADDGRKPLRINVFGAAPDRGVLDEYRSLGIERCLLWLPLGHADTVLPALDTYAELLEE